MADQIVSVSRLIEAPPAAIFDVLADPSRHGEIDGSDTVQQARGNPQRLSLGAKFGMDMRMGPLPYRITNTVEEFEEDRLIAWAHFGGHRWRYELGPVDLDGTIRTEVTESFDWSTANPVVAKGIELAGYPHRHPAGMTRTLERLADVVER